MIAGLAAAAGATATGTALTMTAAQGVLGGLSAYSKARGAKKDAEINAEIGRTRALQSENSAREGLNSELSTIRSTLGANGQGANVGTFEVMQALRKNSDRNRRVNFANRMQESRSYSRQAKASGREAIFGLGQGLAKAGQSMFDMYQYRSQRASG